jgi:hypothetical protein
VRASLQFFEAQQAFRAHAAHLQIRARFRLLPINPGPSGYYRHLLYTRMKLGIWVPQPFFTVLQSVIRHPGVSEVENCTCTGGIASGWLRLQLVTGLARSFRDFTVHSGRWYLSPRGLPFTIAMILKSVTFGEQPLPFQDVAADISTVTDSAMKLRHEHSFVATDR